MLDRLSELPSLIWAFTESDLPTFALPNTGFGILAAYVAPTLTDCAEVPSTASLVVHAAPRVLLLNWGNLLVFDIANQRLPESVAEDAINKPWRPLPRGRINPSQARRLLLTAVPVVWAVSSALGAGGESALILVLTWVYNDLHGGDELTRDFIIALAYDLFLVSSLRIAVTATTSCTEVEFSTTGYQWRGLIAGVVVTTMQIQDLRDQVGDRQRGRKTWPLVLGDASRWWIAGCVMFWTASCIGFWGPPSYLAVAAVLLGGWIAGCVLLQRDDVGCWRWWCFWQLVLYSMPAWS
ncbi:hypothetical protein BDW74DRAFT_183269 [Aspergillus multicolor]|uniref:UbiA family prenyltransferase n=1 Tax=Aspergillus multicolor TaxID=41759 RepID=UPI003CCDD747